METSNHEYVIKSELLQYFFLNYDCFKFAGVLNSIITFTLKPKNLLTIKDIHFSKLSLCEDLLNKIIILGNYSLKLGNKNELIDNLSCAIELCKQELKNSTHESPIEFIKHEYKINDKIKNLESVINYLLKNNKKCKRKNHNVYERKVHEYMYELNYLKNISGHCNI